MNSRNVQIRARKYVLTKYYNGEPKESDFEIVEEELGELNENEILVQALYYSIDPYMRAHMHLHKLPIDMIGRQLAKVIDSRHNAYPIGCYVVDSFGWRSHTITNPNVPYPKGDGLPLVRVPDVSPHPLSISLGILDVPGYTAHFGITEICKPKAGETIVITGAAGAVGSHAGQIAKILGCKVIGFAGSAKKCEYLVNELGFDHAFNYKDADIIEALMSVAPNGVDCYFDNVGGDLSYKIMRQMKRNGRVAVCGSISTYNSVEPAKGSVLQPIIAYKELTLKGFLVYRWADRFENSTNTTLKWVNEGKLKYKEEIYYGFENMVKALNSILRGENIGKAIVKA
ncbi:unnamed protein product [Pieris brassicae]|uniref:Prostaglandin reductase 1 n=2 Tax=Pieris brassicae TaxID=7116 RepID=A0A9P0T9L0_PIEBR|nr:unnamed protein product [Pieris brassicae]